MFERTVFSRTPAGEEALARVDHRLSMALRRTLILVEGHSDGTALRARAPYRDLDESLQALLAQGLIAIPGQATTAAVPVTPAPAAAPSAVVAATSAPAEVAAPEAGGSPAAIRQALFDLCRQVLGDAKAETAAKRILTAGDEPGAIAAALAKTVSVVRLTVDETKANEIKRRGEALL